MTDQYSEDKMPAELDELPSAILSTDIMVVQRGDEIFQTQASSFATAGYVHTQTVLSDTWTINHNLGRKPDATVYSVGGAEIDAAVINVSNNQTVVQFSEPMIGSVRLL